MCLDSGIKKENSKELRMKAWARILNHAERMKCYPLSHQEPLKDFRQRSGSRTFALSKDPHGNSVRYELEGDKRASGQKNNDDPTYSIVHGVDKNI